MTLEETISADMKKAMKEGDVALKDVTRMLLSEVKYAQASVNIKEKLDDKAVLKVIESYQKKLTKALKDYPEGDKRKSLESEIALVGRYLPKRASEDEIEQVVTRVVAGATDKNFGVLMKKVMAELGGNADGQIISQKIKQHLG